MSSSTAGKAPETNPLRPTSFADSRSVAPWETPTAADTSARKDGDRKEESRKAHKESERDRRNIENACIQQLRSLTHSECYMNVKSKYRDEPAKNEILARANAFIMALVLRLNAELARSMALEQQLTELQQEPSPASTRNSDAHSAPSQPTPTRFLSSSPPLHSPSHCPSPSCASSVPHFEAWYASPLCRRWLDGPDGVLARTLALVGGWHAGIAALVRAFERVQAVHPAIAPWNASALVAAFARGNVGAAAAGEGGRAWDTEALVRGLEGTIRERFGVEPASVEVLVNAMGKGEGGGEA
ncbi:hypothetical protein MMC34_002084 [Xylographa carneopallida]|nr:hypothetical protein [Xylographa carneopallida]